MRSSMFPLAALLAGALVPFIPRAEAGGVILPPVILTVGSGGGCSHNSIQSAINAAGAAGTTVIRISNNVAHDNQALTITSKNIELRGGYPGCGLAPSDPDARTTIRGNGGDSVILIDAVGDARTVILRNLVIREGGSSDVLSERGGGVRIQGESLVEIRNTRISDNQSHDGGGISIQGSDAEVLLDDGTIVGEAGGVPANRAVDNGITDGRGGGLSCSGADVDILDARFRLNTSSNNGGGIYANACVIRISPRAAFVEGDNGANGFVTFFENEAGRDGGAIYAVNGNVLWFAFDGSSFAGRATGNRAENSGGAFFLTGNAMSFATFWVRLEGNSATNNGGAVWVGDDASFTFGPSSTMSCNYATCPAIFESGLDAASPVIRGGAIYADGAASVAVVRSILARNSASAASAISASGDAFLILRHVLVHQNFLTGNNSLNSPIEVLAGADADLIHVTMANNARPGGVLVQPPLSSLLAAGATSSINVRNSVFTDDGDVTLRNFALDPAAVDGSCSLSHEDSTVPGLIVGEPAYTEPTGDTPDFSLSIDSDGIDRCANVETFPMSPLPDLRGLGRPFDVLSVPNDAGTWDMGAFESWILTSADIFEDGFEEPIPFEF